jgi:hypothetical protein
MSNVEITAPKQRVIGRPFQPGQSGNPSGRPKGSRNRLADAFVADLKEIWEARGIEALERCATETPEVLIKVIASLLPRSIDLNVSLDAVAFADKFRMACELLGNEPAPRQIRKRLPGQPRVIEHGE